MTSSGPVGFTRQRLTPAQQEPETPVDPSDDPLLTGASVVPPPPSPSQRPRGHRQRRTTLPRATRGWSRSIVWTLIGLTVFVTLYGLFARIDSSIEASGRLRPNGGVTSVSPAFNALVLRLLVREGQRVVAGQPLLQLRDDSLQKQRRELVAIRGAWRKEVETLAYQLGLPASVPDDPATRRQLQVSQLEVRLRSLAAMEEAARSSINTQQQIADLQGLRDRLAINQRTTARLRSLQSAGAISRLDFDRQLERQLELEASLKRTLLEVQSGRRRELESLYKTRQITAANLKQLFTSLDNARQQLRETETRLVDLDERITLSSLRAPIAGRVFDLNVRRGELASPAQPALKIVPGSALEATLDISNRDIGFVRVGMDVEVRIASFPFTEYGSLKGTLVRLSEDALPADATHPQDYFQARVRLSGDSLRRHGKVYALRPGMAVTGLLQLGPRPVISLLGDRLTGFLDSSRTIR